MGNTLRQRATIYLRHCISVSCIWVFYGVLLRDADLKYNKLLPFQLSTNLQYFTSSNISGIFLKNVFSYSLYQWLFIYPALNLTQHFIKKYKKRDIFSKIAHMHMKIGQMQDVRALFNDKKIWKFPFFTPIWLYTLFNDFRPVPSFWNTMYRHL